MAALHTPSLGRIDAVILLMMMGTAGGRSSSQGAPSCRSSIARHASYREAALR
jgi:hypothetical protein